MKQPSVLYRSVAFQLLVSVIPVAILGILLTGVVAYHFSKPIIFDSIKNEVSAGSVDASRRISAYMIQRKNDAEMISENPIFGDYHNNIEFGLHHEAETYRRDIETYLAAFANRTKSLIGIWYFDHRGREVIAIELSTAPLREEFLTSVLLRDNPLTEVVVTDLMRDPAFGTFVLHISPVMNRFREKSGTLILASSFDPIEQIIKSLRIEESGLAYLVLPDGSPAVPGGIPPAFAAPPPKNLYSSRSAVAETPWLLDVRVDLNNYLKPLDNFRFLMVSFGLISAFIVGIFIYFRTNKLLRPIRKLKDATQRLTAGNLDQRVDVERRNEIGVLSQAFNTMAETLQARIRENADLLENIRSSELRYRTTLDCSLDGIVGLDSSFSVATWNKGAQILFGYSPEEATGRSLDLIFPGETASTLKEMAERRGSVVNFDTKGIAKDGREVELNLTLAGAREGNGARKEWSMVIRNVTEQKALQAQLIQAEKLSVVGQLVAGVAHEINNPLTAVVGYSELLAFEMKTDDPQLRDDLKFIHENAVRCKDIVENLLRFVRKEPLQKKAVNLNEVIGDVMRLMAYRLAKKESVEVEWKDNPSLPLVSGDAQQLEQVFLNLFHNACDAMKGMAGIKKIKIQLGRSGEAVEIRLSDNGPGMSKTIREKIFEPFYTTKERGKGTGLGLAISKRIIDEHKGTIAVQSELKKGTTFRISLPVPKTPEGALAEPQKEFPRVTGKKLLIVDDETDLIPLMKKALVDEGNDVDVATSGRSALENAGRSPYDLIVSDIQLGDIRGLDLCRMIRKQRKETLFVLMTGDLVDNDLHQELDELGVACITKPFSLADFRDTVRRAFSEMGSSLDI